MKAINRIIEQAKKKPARIVLCEADDPRVLQAASLVTLEGIANVTLVGKRQSIEQLAKDSAVSLEHIELVDPDESPLTAPFADLLFDLRAPKGMTLEVARREVLKPLCFANLMVRQGLGDGSVAGAVHTTGDVVRNAIQIIGLEQDCKLVSSFFF